MMLMDDRDPTIHPINLFDVSKSKRARCAPNESFRFHFGWDLFLKTLQLAMFCPTRLDLLDFRALARNHRKYHIWLSPALTGVGVQARQEGNMLLHALEHHSAIL